MSFAIDTGQRQPSTRPKAMNIDPDARLSFVGRAEHAERFHRQIIGNIQSMESIADLDRYVADESLILDALFMSFPAYAEAIQQAHEDHRILLQGAADYEHRHAAKSDPADPGASKAQSPDIGKLANGDQYDFF